MVAAEFLGRRYRILISDDDEGCRETVREALAKRGYETRMASCGREAIEVARKQFLHMLIVDMNMPDMNGLDTVLTIRREIAVRVPSILMSADTPRETLKRTLEAEFDSFIEKPFEVGVLRNVVEEIIRRYYE